ncbi:MAG: extracellular solute-binding protein [Chloroflexota bacterium]
MLLFVLGISAVSAQDDLESVDPTGQTVVYWHQYQVDSAQGNTMDAIIADFNANNQWDITVEGSFQGSYGPLGELINAGITSGELPNMVAGYVNAAASYDRDGVVVDLTPYMTSETWGFGSDHDLNESLLAANTIDGRLLAFPNQSSVQVMTYNQDLLTELGFDAPATTRDEFTEQACASANSTGPNGEDRFGFPLTTDGSAFESWVHSAGGNIYHDGAFDFSSEPVISTLQFYQDLYNEGCAYIPAVRFGEQTDFNQGLTPFYVTSSAGFSFIIDGFNTADYHPTWDLMTFPHSEGNESLNAFTPSIIVLQSTPEQDLASWLFLKYLAQPEVGVQWSEGSGYFNPIPSSSEALQTGTFSMEGMGTYFNAANDLLNRTDLDIFSSPPLAAYDTVRGLVSTAIADVTSNGMPAADVAATLQAAADQALADSM